MQYYPQAHRRPSVDGAFVAVDPFRPSVSLGINNIISGQNDPTIDDIPVTRPQPQRYTIPYEGQPYVQPATYLAQPYSQPIVTTQPHSQPIYTTQPHSQPVYTQSQPVYTTQPHSQPIYTQSQPVYTTQPHSQPIYTQSQPIYTTQPYFQPIYQPRRHAQPSEGSSSGSRRGHTQGRHARSPRRSQSRSPRRSSIRRHPRSPRRHYPTEQHYSRSPERRSPIRVRFQGMHRVHAGPHRPRHQRRSPERAGIVDAVPPVSEVRGRPRSPKPLGPKESDETGSSSGDVESFYASARSSPPLASVLPNHLVYTPFILPISPHRSHSPAREQRLGSPRVFPIAPNFGHMSPRHSPISSHHSRTSSRYPDASPIHPPASSQEPPARPPPASQGSIRSTIPFLLAGSLSSASRSRSRSPQRSPQVDHVHPRPASGSQRSRSPRSPPPPPVFLDMPPTVIIQQPAVRPAWRRKSRSQSYDRRRSRSRSPPRRPRKSRLGNERRSPRRTYSWDEWPLPQNVREDRERPPPVVIVPERESRRPQWDSRLPRRHYRRSRSSSSSPRRDHRRRSRSPSILVPADTYDSGHFIPPHSGPHTHNYAPPTIYGYMPQSYAVPLAGEAGAYLRYGVHPRITAYATAFLLDTVPRQIYLHFMLRLPSLYFSRVTRIFEDAEMSMPEIKKMALEATSGWKDPAKDLNRGFIFDPQELTPPYASLQNSWQNFIDSLMREWKTLNIISVLLLSAILTILQIEAAAADPYTRYSALLSLVCALMSLLYGCIYIIRFGTMRKTYKAAEWATEAQKTRTGIWWNVWVMLAMPATWLAWSMILYIFCIMSFVWRAGTSEDVNIHAISPRDALGPRIAITVVFSLGLIYFLLIVSTFRRYGDMMDRAWQQRVWGWAQEKLGYQFVPQPRPYPSPVYSSYAERPQPDEPTTQSTAPFAQHPVQPASFEAYPEAPSHVSPSRDPENPTVYQRTRSLSRPQAHTPSSPHLGPSFLSQVIPPLSSSLLHISPERTRSPSLSPTRTRGTLNRRAARSRSTSQNKKKSRSGLSEQRLSPILADMGTTVFTRSGSRESSRSIARTMVRSRSPAPSQPIRAMDKDVQTYKVLSISPEGVFRWTELEQLFTRGLNYVDWAKFNYESTAGWHDKIDTLSDPERFAVGSNSPQHRLAQVLEWWNINLFRELDAEVVLGEEYTDSNATATFAVYLVIDGPSIAGPLTGIATVFRALPEGPDRIYLYRMNQISDLEVVNLKN
ncbi:hypothetical protein K443DRAFT_610856 [Laccaria amethystina LaAM-08-1]|uniref:Uncharacterized protein n=1 Tax=Laccaria amethystina LaAM-08-1 TaxID=1095629 RepID=A0A0C9X642_9AGAR|nr:hypothetical protein K443DRAFT_610856 [Laccaria amethystina LaAM-08-1]